MEINACTMKTMQLSCNKVSCACDELLLGPNDSQHGVSFPPASLLGTFELFFSLSTDVKYHWFGS